jgi:periplasmic protein TonB
MKAIAFVLFTFYSLTVFGQKSEPENESYYVFDSNWNPCKLESAKYMAYVERINDTTFQWDFYHFTGPLIYIETFSDEKGTKLNGFLAYYDTNGRIDSSGYTVNGKKDGSWYFYDDTLAIWLQQDYNNGKLIKTIDFNEKRKEEAKAGIKPPALLPGEKEADFPGGAKMWLKYLEKNFIMPDRATELGKKGTDIIGFVVDTEGKLNDLVILKSVEFSLDKEALHIIRQSPNWIPAVQGDKKVKAYRRQPITFLNQN